MEETKEKDPFDIDFEVPDWFKRLAAERQEVESRLTKLKAFLAQNPTHISIEQLSLLKKQEKVMQEYVDILFTRIMLALKELEAKHSKED